MESVLEGMAEYYSAELAEKVTRRMKENALKGLWNGSNVPFGYVINKEPRYRPANRARRAGDIQVEQRRKDGKGNL